MMDLMQDSEIGDSCESWQ